MISAPTSSVSALIIPLPDSDPTPVPALDVTPTTAVEDEDDNDDDVTVTPSTDNDEPEPDQDVEEENQPEAEATQAEPAVAETLAGQASQYRTTGFVLGGVTTEIDSDNSDRDQSSTATQTTADIFNLAAEFSREAIVQTEIPSLSEALSLLTSGDYLNAIDGVEKSMEENVVFASAVLGGGTALTTGLSVGYAIWLVRSGVIVSSVLSSLPAWRFVDPLPILQGLVSDSDDEESLQSMVSRDEDNDPSASK